MEISFLLQKYAKLGNSLKRTKEIVLQTLQDDFSIHIQPSDIEIKDTEVKIKMSGVKRTHFTLLKSKIEENIQSKLKAEKILISKIH